MRRRRRFLVVDGIDRHVAVDHGRAVERIARAVLRGVPSFEDVSVLGGIRGHGFVRQGVAVDRLASLGLDGGVGAAIVHEGHGARLRSIDPEAVGHEIGLVGRSGRVAAGIVLLRGEEHGDAAVPMLVIVLRGRILVDDRIVARGTHNLVRAVCVGDHRAVLVARHLVGHLEAVDAQSRGLHVLDARIQILQGLVFPVRLEARLHHEPLAALLLRSAQIEAVYARKLVGGRVGGFEALGQIEHESERTVRTRKAVFGQVVEHRVVCRELRVDDRQKGSVAHPFEHIEVELEVEVHGIAHLMLHDSGA